MIKFLDLQKVTAKNANEIHEVVNRVIDIGWILQGKENEKFEPDYANFFDTKYAVGCANGLDALIWIFRAYFASILVITENGLVPILVELKIDTLEIDGDKIESLITKKTKAISIVHLDGRYTYTEKIGAICKKYNLKLIEDIAQVLGCMAKDSRRTGSLGDAGGHPFYPGKN
jgi:dTDP-4-amino-4,6-dideoxygalactose transaminase